MGQTSNTTLAALALISLISLISFVPAPAKAEPAPVVEWSQASECSRPSSLLAMIAERIGVTPAALAGRLLRLQVKTERLSSASWRARLALDTSSDHGERVYLADSCENLVKATVLIVAVALDPRAVTRLDAGISRRQVAPRPRPAPRGLLRFITEGDLGVLPGLSLDFGIAGGLSFSKFRVELEAAHGLPRDSTLPTLDAGGEIRMLLRGGLRGCYTPWRSRAELGICAEADGGWLRGQGVGVNVPAQGSAFWFALLAGPTAGVRLAGPLWLRLQAQLGASLSRPSFSIQELGEVHRPSLLVGRVGLGLELWLP